MSAASERATFSMIAPAPSRLRNQLTNTMAAEGATWLGLGLGLGLGSGLGLGLGSAFVLGLGLGLGPGLELWLDGGGRDRADGGE